MTKIFGALLVTAVAFGATSTLARDNVANEKQAQLEAFFNAKPTVEAPQTSLSDEGTNDTYIDPNSRVRDVSPDLNEWLTRNHARPADR